MIEKEIKRKVRQQEFSQIQHDLKRIEDLAEEIACNDKSRYCNYLTGRDYKGKSTGNQE